MADGRKNNGWHSTKGKAGRKPKATEQKLIERLSPLDDVAFNQLQANIVDGEKWAIELFFKYRYGMPKQKTDITTNGEQLNIPVINFTSSD